MAKNYTAYDAAAIISSGMNKENALEYQDIMRRFPFFGALCTKLDETGLKLLEILPEYMTARKLNRYLKDSLGIEEPVEDDVDEVEEKPAKKEKKSKKAKKEVEEEDIDDEEEEEEAPKKSKKSKKEEKKSPKKSKKAKEEEEEDDDDDDDFDFDED